MMGAIVEEKRGVIGRNKEGLITGILETSHSIPNLVGI